MYLSRNKNLLAILQNYIHVGKNIHRTDMTLNHTSHSLETYSVCVPRKILNEIGVFMAYELVKWSELNTKPK